MLHQMAPYVWVAGYLRDNLLPNRPTMRHDGTGRLRNLRQAVTIMSAIGLHNPRTSSTLWQRTAMSGLPP